MTDIWAGAKSERKPERLAALAAEARRDLERLNFPAPDWVPATRDAEGRPLLDVLVIGAGLCGQTVGFALLRDGIRNFRIVDRAPKGLEGPWGTTARMEILRSPKQLTGPDLGVPSLTFRAWYEAQHGAEGWQRLHKAGRLDWRVYLLWVRETVPVPVENGVAASALSLVPEGVAVTLTHADGRIEPVVARRVVLSTGRDGAGGARLPSFPGLVAGGKGRCFHSADAIDFARFKDRRVVVLGAGASAFDCAATALEAGAAEVVLSVRRPHLPQVNKSKSLSFPGAMKGFAGLDDATRWRFLTYVFAEQVPPPYESVLRCDAQAAFSIRFGAAWQDVVPDDTGVAIHTSWGVWRFDAAILGTGFDVDLALRPELDAVRDNIALWGDRVGPELAAQDPECARFPYLGPGFELTARDAAQTPGLGRIHVFNWGVTLSHGALAGDIPGLRVGVDRLADALSRSLLAADIDRHWTALQALADPELKPTRRFL